MGTYMELRSPEMLEEFLQQKKKRTGLNASDLARAVGKSRQFISRLRHGHDSTCKPETADLIARFLDVPLAVLFAEKSSLTEMQNNKQRRAA